ncbi:MAG: hypothetical protein GX608_04795, partial [Lentisphaerae bacterium]|nr:hypothetical protein [Lentisphaerota bacterium]
FGTPWPPFDYGSGMGVESVSRKEAVALGLLGPDDHVESAEAEFNAALEASVKDVPPEWRAKLQAEFGDQVVFKGDTASWQGNLIGDLVDRVTAYGVDRPFDSRVFKGQQIDLGQATQRARELAAPHMDISRMKLKLAPDNIKHFFDSHGLDGETRGDQRPITKLDVELVPHVWRNPDKVEPGKAPRSLVFWKRLLGKTRVVEWQQYQGQSVMIPTSMLIKK